MRLIITDRLPLVAGRYTIQETLLELVQAIVEDYANKGIDVVGMVENEENRKSLAKALGTNVMNSTNIVLEHGDELIVFDGRWWRVWYFND